MRLLTATGLLMLAVALGVFFFRGALMSARPGDRIRLECHVQTKGEREALDACITAHVLKMKEQRESTKRPGG